MVSASGKKFKEIIPNNEVWWNPGYIYVVEHINHVLSVKEKL